MAGMLLFAHAGREKITSPSLPVPLKLIKFFGSNKTKNLHLRCSGAAPGWFLPVLRRKQAKFLPVFAEQNRQKRD